MDFDYLDSIAGRVKEGDTDAVGVLSTGERLYVALASNSCELLGSDSIAYALARLEPEAIEALITRHQYDRVNAQVGTAPAQIEDLAGLVRRLVHVVRRTQPDNDVARQATEYLRRQNLDGSPLRESR